MLDSLQENSIWWLLGIAFIALILTITGQLTSRNLPSKERKMRVRKFALVGLALFCFCLPFFKPFVTSSSYFKYEEQIKAENLNTIEDVAKLDREQTRTIERLKEELVELKRDTYRMNIYYSLVVQLLSMFIATGALIYVFRKKEESDE